MTKMEELKKVCNKMNWELIITGGIHGVVGEIKSKSPFETLEHYTDNDPYNVFTNFQTFNNHDSLDSLVDDLYLQIIDGVIVIRDSRRTTPDTIVIDKNGILKTKGTFEGWPNEPKKLDFWPKLENV